MRLHFALVNSRAGTFIPIGTLASEAETLIGSQSAGGNDSNPAPETPTLNMDIQQWAIEGFRSADSGLWVFWRGDENRSWNL